MFQSTRKTCSVTLLAAAIALTLSVAPAFGASVRVANQGDVLSLDPHSFNKVVQLSFLDNVLEALIAARVLG